MNELTWIDGPPKEPGEHWVRLPGGWQTIVKLVDPMHYSNAIAHCPIPKPVNPTKPVPAPPGDLTSDEAKVLWEQGIAIQYYEAGWRDCLPKGHNSEWPEMQGWAFRRKPEPRCVPLDLADWDSSPVWWVRAKHLMPHLVVMTGESHIWIPDRSCACQISYDQLMAWERSSDRIHWSPCRKEAA